MGNPPPRRADGATRNGLSQMSRKFDHVAMLLGGLSAEREVSLNSGKECADALEEAGYRVSRVDVGPDIADQLKSLKPDVCFNALHGKWGEDGCMQGLLETLAIPYTHSGVLASALAMHKEQAKIVLAAAGVPVAESIVVARKNVVQEHQMARPYVIKPVAEGSSVGVYIVNKEHNAPPMKIAEEGDGEDELMIERYIPGRELTSAVVGDTVLGVTEILPAEGLDFYDYEAKYAEGGSKHVLPANISSNIYRSIQKLALRAHKALGCRGVTRTDFRFDDQSGGAGELICLEVNTQPGMTVTSLVPELARHHGWTFGDLVCWIVEDASCHR